MSREIDERIVSMQFENRNFEKNANQSMSTLDKLKEKLNFKAAAKGVDNLDAAVKKVDFSSMGKSIDTVGLRFNAMYTIADQTFRNIINSAEQTAKRMVSAFTIDPVKTGFSEYETQINAVQTIMANVGHKGKTLDDVNSALDELNEYADQTIYNFTEMTKNIGLFTNAGVGLEESVAAIKGFSNAAAMAGTDSTSAARAMYQLSQAMSSGSVKLLDWKSLETANITGERFQETAKMAARVHGIAIDEMIEEKGNFRETLAEGWLTADLMSEILDHYTLSTTEMTKAEIEANKTRLKSIGYTEEQIESLFKLGTEANDAATKVKTFTQLWDVMKESAQSGWTSTWEIIVGDFEEAKALMTPLANFLTGVIDKMSDARNFLVQNALAFAAPWDALKKKLDDSGIGTIVEKVADYTDKLKYFQDIMHSVWMGDYKNADTGRYGLLDMAGYDHRVVQELVNISDTHYKEQGWKYQLTVDDIRAAHEKYGIALDENSVAMKENVIGTQDLTTALDGLSDAQLKEIGLTDDEVKILRELQEESKRTGRSIESIAEEMSKFQGRDLLIDSLKNAWSGLFSILKAVGGAWTDIFPPIGFVQLYNAVKGINDFSKKLVVSDETADNLRRTLRGVFAILDIVTTLVGGGFKIAFKAVKALLGLFNIDILEFTAMIGDAAVGLRDWIDSILDFEKIFKGLGNFFKNSWKAIKNWIAGLKETDNIPKYIVDSVVNGFNNGVGAVSSAVFNFGKKIIHKLEEIFGIDFSAMFAKVTPLITKVVDKFKEWFGVMKESKSFSLVASMFEKIGGSIKDWILGLKNVTGTKEIAKYIISGLVNGLREGIKTVGSTILELGKNLVATIKEFLGIHSPSKVFFAIGGFIIAGLIGGLIAGETDVWNTIKDIGSGCVEALKSVDWGALLAVATIAGFLIVINKISNALSSLASPFAEFENIMKAFAGTTKAVKNVLNAYAIKTIAISIAILTASIIGLAMIGWKKALPAVGMVVVLIGSLVGALYLIDKMGENGEKTVLKFTLLIASIGGAMLLLAITATIMSKINKDGFANMTKVLLAFTMVLVGLAMITKIATNNELGALGKTLMSMAVTIAILAIVMKKMSGLTDDQFSNGFAAVIALTLIIYALVGITKIATNKELDTLGKTLMSMAGTIAILAIVMKMMSGMDENELTSAIKGMSLLVGVIFLLTLITTFTSEKEMKALGKTLMSMAGAIAVLALIALVLGKANPETFEKGMVAIVKLTMLIMLLVAITWLTSEKEMDALGKTLLSMSLAIGVLAIVAVLLGLVKPDTLKQGLLAITILSLCIGIMVAATSNATDCMKNLIVIAAAIAILGGIVIALSCMDPNGVYTGTAAMTLLLGMLSLLVLASSKASGSFKTLLMLTVMVGVAGTLLTKLSKLPYQNTIGAAIALSALMLAMTGVLFILEKMNVKIGSALKGILALTAMAIPLLAFVGVLALMQNVKNAESSVKALTSMVIAMTIMLIPLTIIGNFAAQAVLGAVALTAMAIPLLAFVGVLALMQNVTVARDNLTALITMTTALTLLLIPLTIIGTFAVQALSGVIALTAMALPLLAFVGVLALMQNIEGATTNTMLLITLMTVMTDCLVKIALVAPLALIAVVAVAALLGVITAFGVLVTAIGALNELTHGKLEEFIDSGIPLMIKMAEGLGLMIGKFITALAGEVMTLLPMLGASLSAFAVNAMPFIMIAKLVDEKVLAGVGILSGAVLALTAVDIINGIASFFTGGFAQLGTELSMFMTNAMPFIMGASLLNADMMTGVKALADTILLLTAADIISGLTSWLTGGSSLAEFGSQLAPLGTSIRDFVTNLGEFTPTQVETVKCAANAIKTLASAASEIPNTGGLLGDLVGNNDMGVFAAQFPILAGGIRMFLQTLGTFTPEEQDTIKCASEALKTLASAASEIPNTGGLLGDLVGNNDMGLFAAQFPLLGGGIRQFLHSIGEFTPEQQDTVKCAADVIKTLAKVSKDIPNTGGLLAKLVGDNDLGTFASKFPKVGEGIKNFANKLGTFGYEKLKTVDAAVEVIKSLASLAKVDIKGATKQLEGFGKNIVDFGTKIATFATNVMKTSSATYGAAVQNVKAVINVAKDLNNGGIDAIKNFSDTLDTLGSKSLDKFIDAFTGTNDASKIKIAASTMTSNITSALDTQIFEFESAGKDFGSGLIRGILSKQAAAWTAGYALGRQAVLGEKAGQQSNSPSKLTFQAGKWIGEGLVNGMVKMTSAVYGAGYDLGELATDSISSTVNRISSALENDIDVQPTIRPVLDLSEVTSGANAIGGLFSGRRTLTIDTGLVGTVSASMANRQNGSSTADVVSSIKALRKDLANMPRESININGITYDDGSNIAEAVHTLVRAAKIEGRV